MGATYLDKLWALISCAASIATAVGFYLPYWLEGVYASAATGTMVTVQFGVFRKCSYPEVDEDGDIKSLDNCGRFVAFMDIPSVFWQISAVTIGLGAILSLLLSILALATLCLKDMVTAVPARAVGVLQMSAGTLVLTGVLIYPNGWGAPPVLQVCGYKSGVYQLGSCSLNWGFHLTAVGGAVSVMCSILAWQAFKYKSYRTSYDV